MEYVQMTLNDWMEIKRKLKLELLGVKQSFVRIGFALRKIEDQKLYEQDGYKSVAEFAKAEYGLEPSTTSRFMSINREYSVDGYSETLRPEFEDLSRSQLEEMLKLPESDRTMIQPETQREDIRELKRFNKEEPAAGSTGNLLQLAESFYRDNPDILEAVSAAPGLGQQDMKRFAEMVNPGGNKSYRQGIYFMMMYEERIAVKKYGGTPQDLSWWDFYHLTLEALEEIKEGREEETGKPAQSIEKRNQESEKRGQGPKKTDQNPEGPKQEIVGEKPTEIAPAQEKPENAVQEKPLESDQVQVPGQMEITKDMPEYCPSEENEPETEKEEPVKIAPAQEKPENTEREEDFMNAPEIVTEQNQSQDREPAQGNVNSKSPYSSRKQYLDNCTGYDAAAYIANTLKGMRNITFSNLTDTDFWAAWMSQEVDDKGKKIEVVE